MVQAIIKISERTNRVLNIIKAKYGLKDKSEAINVMAEEYEKDMLEPELRPEFVKKIKNLEAKGRFKTYTSLSSFRKEIENA